MLSLLVPLLIVTQTPVSIYNPTFDQTDNVGGQLVPRYWNQDTTTPPYPYATVVPSFQGHTNVVKMDLSNGHPTNEWPSIVQTVWNIVPGSVYEAQADIWIDEHTIGRGLSFDIKFRNSSVIGSSSMNYPVAGEGEWKTIVVYGQAPANTSTLELDFFLHGQGVAYIDNVSLTKTDKDYTAPTGAIDINVTDQVTCNSIIGFGAQDDGWFYNTDINPQGTSHYDDREDRIEWLDPDWIRMFMWQADWYPNFLPSFDFATAGKSCGWNIPTWVDDAKDLTVANGKLSFTFESVGTTFSPTIYGPLNMEPVDCDTNPYIFIDMGLTSATSNDITVNFRWDDGTGFDWQTRNQNFTVTPNAGIQNIVLDLSSHQYWTGDCTQVQLIVGWNKSSELDGQTCDIDLFSITDSATSPGTPGVGAYNWNSPNMLSTYDTLDVYQSIGAAVNIVGWPKNMLWMYEDVDEMVTRTADMMEYLIETKGYTCVKYWTHNNEPNLEFGGEAGEDFDEHLYVMEEVAAEFASRDLDVQIVGADSASSHLWFEKCTSDSSYDAVTDVYSSHWYPSEGTHELATRYFDTEIGFIDGASPGKPYIIGEYGFAHGYSEFMDDYDYAMCSAEFLIDAMNSGVSGASIWILQQMNYPLGIGEMAWGLWKGPSSNWAIRPTYHAVGMFTRLTDAGDKAIECTSSYPLHAKATRVEDTIFWVNQSSQANNLAFDIEGDPVIRELCIIDENTVGTAYNSTGTVTTYVTNQTICAPARSFGYATLSYAPPTPDFDTLFAALTTALGAFDLNGPTALTPNYMADLDEFAMLEELLTNSSLPEYDDVRTAWAKNYDQLVADMMNASAYIDEMFRAYIAGLITIGDDDSYGLAEALAASSYVTLTSAAYDRSNEDLLAKDGDADDDGVTNYGEYTANVGFAPYDRTAYLTAALDDSAVLDGTDIPDMYSIFVALGNPTLDADANGMWDMMEFMLVEEIISTDSLLYHHGVTTAWTHNWALMQTDLAPYQTQSVIDVWGLYIAAYMTLDETDVAELMFGILTNYQSMSAGYDSDAAYLLQPTSDPDGDTYNNLAEYNETFPELEDYLDYALDPQLTP